MSLLFLAPAVLPFALLAPSQDAGSPPAVAAQESVPAPAGSPPADLWEATNLDGGPAPAGTWTLGGDGGSILRCSGGPTGFLASQASYRTMELEFEWRWPGKAGNSGLLLFTESLGFVGQPGLVGGWPRNLEVQLQSGDAGHFVTLGPGVELDVLDPATGDVHAGERIRGIFRRRAVDDVEKPLGEWNKMRVEVGLDQIVVYVNGVEVNRASGGSLTAAHPKAFQPGPFAFQSEGTPIEFRSIAVKGQPVSPSRSLIQPTDEDPLRGWTPVYRKPEEAEKGPFASLDGDEVRISGQPGGYLRLDDALGANYRLSLEWRWEPERTGNSGVLLHVTQPDVLFGWPQSLEVQLQSGSAGDFWVIGDNVVDLKVPGMDTRRAAKRAGNLHAHRRIQRLPFDASPEREPGSWNRMSIDVADDKIRVFVNGRMVNEGSGLTVRAGAIALQSEGAPIRFRRILVR